MKKFILPAIALLLSISLSGCGLVEDVFKAGLIFALVIIAIIGLIVWLARMVTSFLERKYDIVLFSWD